MGENDSIADAKQPSEHPSLATKESTQGNSNDSNESIASNVIVSQIDKLLEDMEKAEVTESMNSTNSHHSSDDQTISDYTAVTKSTAQSANNESVQKSTDRGLDFVYDEAVQKYADQTLDYPTDGDDFVIDENNRYDSSSFYANSMDASNNPLGVQHFINDFWRSDRRVDRSNEPFLLRYRNYLADYQELHGTPRDEYTFSSLIKVMGQSVGRCLEALFFVVKNVVPVFQIFVHIVRFILDKLLDLNSTEENQQKVLKILIFMVQLLSIYICLVFIFGFIVMPVVKMAFGILAKVMLYD